MIFSGGVDEARGAGTFPLDMPAVDDYLHQAADTTIWLRA